MAVCVAESSPDSGSRRVVLLASVFAVAAAGLVYELVAGTLSTYLLGGSVLVFSLVIGWFLSAMGLGAFLAQYVRTELERAFVAAEIALALFGGMSAVVLFAAFAVSGPGYPVALALVCAVVGALVGIEIPLLLRILEERGSVRVAVSHVLALDYVGALIGSIAFPLLLLPHLGVVRSSALLGLMNLVVAGITLAWMRDRIARKTPLIVAGAATAVLLSVVFVTGLRTTSFIEDRLYTDHIMLAESTPYQRIVVTTWRDDVRLYLDGHLQFAMVDEYRYHEALVFPALASPRAPVRVLVLGGGDGLAARRILDTPGVRHVDVVDLDPRLTALFAEHPALSALNGHSLTDPRLTVHNQDAVAFLEANEAQWDVIIMDLPDPNDAGLARLYALSTFQLAMRRLADDGALVTQATSPFHAPDAFWSIVHTLETAIDGPVPRAVHPYHTHIPSFGEWGFALVTAADVDVRTLPVPDDARFLTAEVLPGLFSFPADIARRDVAVNRLGDAVLSRYYAQGWRRYAE